MKVEKVYKGKEIYLGLVSLIDVSIYKKYTLPNGNALVHRSQTPVIPPLYVGCYVTPFNPWRESFNKYLGRIFDSGLAGLYKKNTLEQLRKEALLRGEETVSVNERPDISPMNLDDFQGVFMFLGIGLVFSGLVLLLESQILGIIKIFCKK